jgi:hypothetical protein
MSGAYTGPELRREPRIASAMRVGTSTVDPVFDPVTRARCYSAADDDVAMDVSRRGLRLHCAQPPRIGTRIVIHIPGDGPDEGIEIVGCARWTAVEFEPGAHGARAIAAVGIELVGGTRSALDRFEQCVSLHQANLVAGPQALR